MYKDVIGVTALPTNPDTTEGQTLVASQIGATSGQGIVGLSGGGLHVPAGVALRCDGQTGGTSGTNVANQPVGFFKIPSGTASGSTVVVPNGLVTALSIIQLTAMGLNNLQEMAVTARSAGTSFTVTILSSANIAADTDVAYLIIN